MNDKNYNYEVKCRRCGTFTVWHFASADNFDWMMFLKAMADHVQNPRWSECKKCKKHTIQDLVSHSPKGGE